MLTGKQGTLEIRERSEWAEVGSDVNRDVPLDRVGFGTWTVARATGVYAGIQETGGVPTWVSASSGSHVRRACSECRSALYGSGSQRLLSRRG